MSLVGAGGSRAALGLDGRGARPHTIQPKVFSLSKPRAISYNLLTFGMPFRLSLCKARLICL